MTQVLTAAEARALLGGKKPLPASPVQLKPPAPTKDTKAPVAAAEAQEITFPGWQPGNNGPKGLLRMGWRNRQRLAQYYDWQVAAARLRAMLAPVRLELVRYSAGGQLDFDNLVSTGKYPIDAIVRAGILPDDNPAVIAERSYTQERAASKDQQRTVIRLIPL